VCFIWKYEADFYLRDKIKVKITSSDQLAEFCNEIQSNNFLFPDYEMHCLQLERALNFFDTFGQNITTLTLSFCDWRSTTLRTILFKKLPNLQILEVSTHKNAGQQWSDPLIPMSFIPYGSFSPLLSLKALRIFGDYSNRTDLFYDILKSSPNLEIIRLSKFHPDHDDLFGTWLTEIILSCQFPNLRCLELECVLIQQQINSISSKQYPLKRLCFDLDFNDAQLSSLDTILQHFRALESAEFGIDNASKFVANAIIHRYKNYKCWVAIQSRKGSKIMFPNHALNLES